jgi:2-oxo-4-hydroxy-4-carboxy--5-ureidoimidazoline (OHCU) decarboxylase
VGGWVSANFFICLSNFSFHTYKAYVLNEFRRPKSAIIPILEQRLNNTASEELNTGLKAMLDIARDRLSKLLPQNKL